MFDFIVFFLIFLPLMDIIRHMRTSTMTSKVFLTVIITSIVGSYFVYTSVLAGKFIISINRSFLNGLSNLELF